MKLVDQWRRMLRLVDAYLMGYDVFVSYAWGDGREYSERLFSALTQMGYRCFLDSQEYAPGTDFSRDARHAVRMSAAAVVIVTPFAVQSRHVQLEVLLFDETGKPLIPVDLAATMYQRKTAIDGAERWVQSETLTLILDRAATVDRGHIADTLHRISRDRRLQIADPCLTEPAQATIDALSKRFRFARRARRRVRAISVVCLVLVALLLATLLARYEAVRQRELADQRLVAERLAKRTAESRRLGATSDAVSFQSGDQALLVAMEAFRVADTPESRGALYRRVFERPGAPGNWVPISTGPKTHVRGIAYSDDGKLMAIVTAEGENTYISVLKDRVSDGGWKEVKRVPCTHRVYAFGFSPSGDRLAFASATVRRGPEGEITSANPAYACDLQVLPLVEGGLAGTGRELPDAIFDPSDGPTGTLTFDATGGDIYISSGQGSSAVILVCDSRDEGLRTKKTIKLEDAEIMALALVPQRDILMAAYRIASDRGVARTATWDTRTGALLSDESVLGARGEVGRLALSKDGRQLAVSSGFFNRAGGGSFGIWLWDIGTRTRIVDRPLKVEYGHVVGIAFHPLESLLAIASGTNSVYSVRVQPLPSDNLLGLVRPLARRNMTLSEWWEVFPDQTYRPTFLDLPLPAFDTKFSTVAKNLTRVQWEEHFPCQDYRKTFDHLPIPPGE